MTDNNNDNQFKAKAERDRPLFYHQDDEEDITKVYSNEYKRITERDDYIRTLHEETYEESDCDHEEEDMHRAYAIFKNIMREENPGRYDFMEMAASAPISIFQTGNFKFEVRFSIKSKPDEYDALFDVFRWHPYLEKWCQYGTLVSSDLDAQYAIYRRNDIYNRNKKKEIVKAHPKVFDRDDYLRMSFLKHDIPYKVELEFYEAQAVMRKFMEEGSTANIAFMAMADVAPIQVFEQRFLKTTVQADRKSVV